MADSNTEAATPTESGVQKGSEFSKPVGAKDDEVWTRHFGKDAKEAGGKPKRTEKPSDKPSASTSKPSSDEKGSKAPPKQSDKPASASTRDDSDGKREKPSTPKDAKPDKTTDKKPDKDAKDSTESTGRKTAEEKTEPTDPEAPSKKARDLFQEAKKAEDPREARKLYKRAMKEAFGEVPEEFDDSRYAAVRKERKAAHAALDEKAQKNEGRIREAAERLKPSIFVMRKLEDAKLGDKLTVPMVEKAISVMQALRSIEDGDFTQLAEVVSRAAGVDHDEAMKRFIRGTKVSPEGKAARAATEQAQRDNQALRERMQVLERQLQEGKTEQTAAQKQAEHAKEVADNRARWIDDITTELDGHAALKLPRGAERVLSYLIRTANPQTKAPRYSFEEAGNRIVAAERKRVQGARHLLDEDGDEPARETPRRLSGVPRGETVDAGVRNESPEASFDRIYSKHSAGGRR